jgi:hypothetical protein
MVRARIAAFAGRGKRLRRLGGVDKFHSATAGGKNRQFEEARKRNIGNIVRRADAEMAVFGPAPKGVAL